MFRYLEMPPDFPQRVHQALRTWHVRSVKDTLTDLLLAQQTQPNQAGLNPRLTSNQILLDGLECLKQINLEGTDLLQRRFLDQETALELAHRYNLSEDIIFQRQRAAIGQLAEIVWQQEQDLRQKRARQIEARLEPLTYSRLFGIADKLAEVQAQLETTSAPWLVAIEGLGGIGKTALADALVRDLALTGSFQDIGWVSARQLDFLPATGLQPTDQPALEIETLTHSLLNQFGADLPPTASAPAKLAALKECLKAAPYLIVIDNLETALDYQTLLPTLYQLANPSRFLLTSRHSLRAYPEVYCCPLPELSQADTMALLRHEAQVRGIPALANAAQAQLDSIYRVVGGNPLALKLVVGQIAVLPLPQVLDNLKQAQGKKVDELYTYIYWQVWHRLEPTAQHVLLAMPLAQNGDLAHLQAVTQLDPGQIFDALEQLTTLSLVEVGGDDLLDRHYRIHRLTETFLLTEVTSWPRAN
ncbi:MAG TPA: NB-ARC domain-containing protein [Anaerolineae bacterium]|nr:NB-ARC domain-containing protein [Anaerolineae bacterium]